MAQRNFKIHLLNVSSSFSGISRCPFLIKMDPVLFCNNSPGLLIRSRRSKAHHFEWKLPYTRIILVQRILKVIAANQ